MTRYLLLFDSYGLVFCGAPSLTRGRVCLLYMLLTLVSAVFLGSESHGTRNHILLSQIWDFPFRRLLRLAGSASKPFFITTLHGPRRKQPDYLWEGVFTTPLRSNGSYSIVAFVFFAAGKCVPSRYLATDVSSDFTVPGVMSHYDLDMHSGDEISTHTQFFWVHFWMVLISSF
jgi:hypothetical protein